MALVLCSRAITAGAWRSATSNVVEPRRQEMCFLFSEPFMRKLTNDLGRGIQLSLAEVDAMTITPPTRMPHKPHVPQT
jgi:hypothetical protein